MLSLGVLEIALICVVGLVCIGPENLPKVMVEIGKFFVQVRRMSNEVKSSVNEAVREANLEEEKKKFEQGASFKEAAEEKLEDFLGSEAFLEEIQEENKGSEKKSSQEKVL